MTKQISLQIIIIIRLLQLIYNEDLFVITIKYISFITALRKKSGLPYTIKYLKAAKLHITRYICGKPLRSNSAGVALDSNGFPVQFLYLKELIDNGKFRSVLTLLTYSRSIKPSPKELEKVKPDYSTITAPYKGKAWTIPASFIKEWVLKNNLNHPLPYYTNNDHYISTKGSPNGPATFSGTWSLKYLGRESLSYIFGMINKTYWKDLAAMLFLSHLDIAPDKYKEDPTKHYIGKVAIVKDPELKMRIIAMVDYLSQFTLRRVHDHLLHCLKKLNQDRTFTQDPYNSWSENGDHFYSLDLSAATDRFPVILQKKLLSYIYKDSKFANNWMNLLTKRDFYVPSLLTTIRYSVGQPMGAYSSWAAFTITHHLVVAYSAHLAGYTDFNDYILLGDDIVIKNDKVACKYKAIMTKLGVDISVPKTHVSKDTYEFAKRWIKGGREITGIPLRGILNNWRSPRIVFLEIWNYLKRVPVAKLSTLDLVCKLYERLPIGKRNKSFNQMRDVLYDFNHTIRFTADLVTYDELRSFLVRKLNLSYGMIPTEKVTPSFLRALFGVGMIGECQSLNKKIKESVKSFDTYWTKVTMSIDDYKKFINNSIKASPLYKAYFNKVENSIEMVKGFFSKTNDKSYQEIILNLQFEEFDKIVSLHRKAEVKYILLSKLWNKSIKTLFYKDPLYLERYIKIQNALKEQSHLNAHFYNPREGRKVK